ncbi:hypothetical protein KZO37_21445 [Rhodococcus fascians]|uniref:hypothetical protein n=1 Tax=Rhodococcoides fascians TaxID=1828 RepID=UPI001C5F8C8D|nr:hypothetical protein [Rhodococcus fascians]MBW4781930.1 hypothetical protein [Rhodococcus fascians]
MDTEQQRNAIIDFYQHTAAAGSDSDSEPHPLRKDVVDSELGAMLGVWDEVCSAHDDPWQAIRNECSMYVFPQHSPWGSPDDENFLLVLRGVLEGRGLGFRPTPYDIR